MICCRLWRTYTARRKPLSPYWAWRVPATAQKLQLRSFNHLWLCYHALSRLVAETFSHFWVETNQSREELLVLGCDGNCWKSGFIPDVNLPQHHFVVFFSLVLLKIFVRVLPFKNVFNKFRCRLSFENWRMFEINTRESEYGSGCWILFSFRRCYNLVSFAPGRINYKLLLL